MPLVAVLCMSLVGGLSLYEAARVKALYSFVDQLPGGRSCHPFQLSRQNGMLFIRCLACDGHQAVKAKHGRVVLREWMKTHYGRRHMAFAARIQQGSGQAQSSQVRDGVGKGVDVGVGHMSCCASPECVDLSSAAAEAVENNATSSSVRRHTYAPCLLALV